MTSNSRSITRYGRSPGELVQDLTDLKDVYVARKKKWDDTPKADRTGQPPAFRGRTYAGGISTEDATDRIIVCCRKGCLTNAVPRGQDYYKIGLPQPQTGLQQYGKMSSSGQNEAHHKEENRLVEHVAQISDKVLHKKIMLRVFLHNASRDRKLGWLPQHPQVPLFRMELLWRLAQTKTARASSMYDGIRRPPPAATQQDSETGEVSYVEPMGFDYLSRCAPSEETQQ